MQIEMDCSAPLSLNTACLVLGVWQDRIDGPLLQQLDRTLHGALRQAVERGAFVGKEGQTLLFEAVAELPARRVMLVGLGAMADADSGALRKAAAEGARILQAQRLGEAVVALGDSLPDGLTRAAAVQALTEGLLLSNYRFDRYVTRTRDELPPLLGRVRLSVEGVSDAAEGAGWIERAQHICRGVALARDLVNEPGNVKSPEFLAVQAQRLAEQRGLVCTVLDEEQLAREGFGALLAVARGSVRPPRLIVLEYRGGDPEERPVVLVGKGVVFDSGGISLKPGEKMDEMKMDMAGAAAVFGALDAAAGLGLSVNLVGVVPAVENLPSGTAYRPGDVVTSLSGQTVEIINTDAEGRLILADALTYAGRLAPRAVIDLATLTGACIIALGHEASAVFSNRDELAGQLLQAGEASGERLWRLPLWADYDKQIKSDVADVKNSGGRPAGTITAAAFLQRFAPDGAWAHLDIAGTAWEEKGHALCPKGATGVGVRLLTAFLQQAADKK